MNSLQVVETFNSLINDVQNSIQELNGKLSECDLQQQDILHFIENRKLNASQISKIFKILREIRINRRKVKIELNRYISIFNKLNAKLSLIENPLKIKKDDAWYEFKTNVLLDSFGYSAGQKLLLEKDTEIVVDNTKEGIEESNSDNNEDVLDISFMDHPEGRHIVMTNLQTGEVIEVKNFEKAVLKAVGNKKASSTIELIKNVSGVMKALKLGNDYLGFKWEVK